MSGTIDLHFAGARVRCDRDRLATAILLRLDHPDDVRAVVETLEAEHGVEHYEAMRLAIAASKCITDGIEP